MRILTEITVVTALAITGAGTEVALSAVHYDPTSPAGKEYALPLNAARSTGAAGGAKSQDPTGSRSPRAPGTGALFGAGVTPAPRHGTAAHRGVPTSPGGTPSPPDAAASGGASGDRAAGFPTGDGRGARRVRSQAPGSGLLIGGGAIVAVLSLAGLTALGLRRGAGTRSRSEIPRAG
jgi:hypothetical protein